MITWRNRWIDLYTDLICTLEVLRKGMLDGEITGFLISPSYFHDGYNVYTFNTEVKS